MFQSLRPQARPLFGGAVLLAGFLVGGCSAKVNVPSDQPGVGGTGSGGTGMVAGGTGGSTGGSGPEVGGTSSGGLGATGGTAGGAGTSSTAACIGSPLPMAKRV